MVVVYSTQMYCTGFQLATSPIAKDYNKSILGYKNICLSSLQSKWLENLFSD